MSSIILVFSYLLSTILHNNEKIIYLGGDNPGLVRSMVLFQLAMSCLSLSKPLWSVDLLRPGSQLGGCYSLQDCVLDRFE
jgi:hypothetical protein